MSEAIITVHVTHHFSATPAQVFSAWLRPEMLRRWFAAGVGEITHAEVHPVVGGHWRVVQQLEGEREQYGGHYLSILPDQHVSFTLTAPDDEGEDRVAVDMIPYKDGCTVELRYELDAEFADYAENARLSWVAMLEAMDNALQHAGAKPAADTH